MVISTFIDTLLRSKVVSVNSF